MRDITDFDEDGKPQCELVSDEDEIDDENAYRPDYNVPGFQETIKKAEERFDVSTSKECVEDGACMTVEQFWDDALHDNLYSNLKIVRCKGGQSGIVYGFDRSDGKPGPAHELCHFFTVVGDATDPRTGQVCLAIQFRDRFKRARDLLIPRSLVAEGGAKLASFLAGNGFDIPPGKKLREVVQLLFHCLRGPRVEIVTRTGWHGDVFVLPNEIIGDIGTSRIIADLSDGLKMRPHGTFTDWERHVAGPCRGNSRLILALSTALASPLLKFAPSITAMVVHLFGPSSIGKSTAVLVAGSVWGGAPDDHLGYAESWNGTANAHLAKAAARSGTLYALDEMRTGENIMKIAYALSSGQGRGRLDKNGALRKEDRFGVFSISTGEVTFEEKERQSSPRPQMFDGAEMRLPSIPADAGAGYGLFEYVHGFDKRRNAENAGERFAEYVGNSARKYYGHAGPLFVKKLLEYIGAIDEDEDEDAVDFTTHLGIKIDKFVTSLNLDPRADDAVKRSARTFGLIAAAGQLASEFDIVPIPAEEMAAGVRKCFLDWLASRGGARSKTAATALIGLRDFISKNMGRFVPAKDAATTTASVIAGYRDDRVFYVLPSAWKEVLALAPRAKLVEELDRLGLLIRQRSRKGDQYAKKLPGGLYVRCYAISGRILALADDGAIPESEDGSASDDDHDGDVIDLNARRLKQTLRRTSR